MLAGIVAAGLLALMIGVAAAAAYTIYRGFADDLVEPDAIVDTQRSLGTSRIFDRDGEAGVLLFEFADPLLGLSDPVRLHEVSQFMIDATVATEDASFWDNEGINLRGLMRAAWENFGTGSSDFLGGSGGSSITQQLVKNVLVPVEERSGRTAERVRGKIKETILAVELTGEFSKEQILEWYLNSIFYGNFSYGIGAASQRYFGKPPAELTLPEAALLAGLPQAPSLYNPIEHFERAKGRQADVLDLMARHDYITQDEADAAKVAPLRFDSKEFEIVAPHFVLYVRAELLALCERGQIPVPDSVGSCEGLMARGGLRITTSIDMQLQTLAEREVETAIAGFEEQTGAHNGSLVALDPANGEIRAMVGSRDFFAEELDGQVNLATALHSPGSSIKPLTYLSAFQLDPRRWHPATVIWDVPTRWEEFDGTVFEPTNFDERFRGPVTARSALANSMNIPAFRVASEIGVPYLLDTMHQLGITTMHDASNYGPSITLGGGDVSLLDMTYAYAAVSRNGLMVGQPTLRELPSGYRELDPVSVIEVRNARGEIVYSYADPEQRAVARPAQSFLITHILSDNNARSLLYGPQLEPRAGSARGREDGHGRRPGAQRRAPRLLDARLHPAAGRRRMGRQRRQRTDDRRLVVADGRLDLAQRDARGARRPGGAELRGAVGPASCRGLRASDPARAGRRRAPRGLRPPRHRGLHQPPRRANDRERCVRRGRGRPSHPAGGDAPRRRPHSASMATGSKNRPIPSRQRGCANSASPIYVRERPAKPMRPCGSILRSTGPWSRAGRWRSWAEPQAPSSKPGP